MIVVTGATGQLGTAFTKLLPDATFLSRADLDLVDTGRITHVLDRLAPDTLINCAAYTAVDAAESDEETAYAVNASAVEAMAVWCARHEARFVTFSTNYVFDGTGNRPYVESDPTAPINAYGRSKAAGESLTQAANPAALIVRTSWLISGTHRNFVTTILDRVQDGPVQVVNDQWGCPTVADDLARATLQTIAAGPAGILHLTNLGPTTWYHLARETIELAGFDPSLVQSTTSDAVTRPAPRPTRSILASERLSHLGIEPLPPWEQSLPRVVRQLVDSDGTAR